MGNAAGRERSAGDDVRRSLEDTTPKKGKAPKVPAPAAASPVSEGASTAENMAAAVVASPPAGLLRRTAGMEHSLYTAGDEEEGSQQVLVPTVFHWKHGGREVYVAGSFNKWKERIPLVKSQGDFTTIVNLPPGKHKYKFIVDDHWVYNKDSPIVSDGIDQLSNVVEVSEADNQFDWEDIGSFADASEPPGEYGQVMPDFQAPHKPPPVLPPHLSQVLLNENTSGLDDPTLLPVPSHVSLNHLYALSIKDGVMVLGVTQRFRKKFVTTVLYRPV